MSYGKRSCIVYTKHHKLKTDSYQNYKIKIYQSPKSCSHIKNTVPLTILTLRHIQCLHLMHPEVAWVLVSSGTQVQLQAILNPDFPPDFLSVSYDYGPIQVVISLPLRVKLTMGQYCSFFCATSAAFLATLHVFL